MTGATKPMSALDAPRRNGSIAGHNVQHASQTLGNVTGLSETIIERLLKRNDVVLLMECEQRVWRIPYRGKQRRVDVLRFLRIAGPRVQALVFSHQGEEGPVWIDVMSGEVSTR